MTLKQKIKEEWKIIGSVFTIGVFMTVLYYWLFTPVTVGQPNIPPLEPSPEPHVVVLDTFSSTALKSEIVRQNIQYSDIVYNQARLETGNFKSEVFKKNNNLFGFVGRKGYIKYNAWQESVRDYKNWQLRRYKSGNYYTFLKECGYAEDSLYIYKLQNF